MAPGFFAKLGEIAKKVWNGGKKVVQGIAKYGLPVLQQVAGAFGAMPDKRAQAFGNGLNRGLSVMQPVINRLAGNYQ